MTSPTIELNGKILILLSGIDKDKSSVKSAAVQSPEQLLLVVRKNPDAVAFGYTSGRWVAAA